MVRKISTTIVFLTTIVAMATFQPKEKAVIRNPFVVEVPNLIEIYEKNHKKITTSAGALQIEGQQSLSSAIVSANPQDIVAATPKQNYSDEDLYWLSRLIQAEAGSDYCTDELQKKVANVIINRVNSGLYLTTIKGVVFQKYNGNYQYDCVKSGSIYKEPSERAIANAKAVLNGELYFPANVIGQAEFPQFTGTYDIVDFGRGLMYFSYSNKVK